MHLRELMAQDMLPGIHSIVWDSTDETGNNVSSGVYIYQLQAGKFTK